MSWLKKELEYKNSRRITCEIQKFAQTHRSSLIEISPLKFIIRRIVNIYNWTLEDQASFNVSPVY